MIKILEMTVFFDIVETISICFLSPRPTKGKAPLAGLANLLLIASRVPYHLENASVEMAMFMLVRREVRIRIRADRVPQSTCLFR